MFTSTTTSEYSIFECPPISRPLLMDRTTTTTKWKCNNIEIAPNCPRCASTNTKFCYYNNYSLSQPRYFCKACRRYWTKGGSLRNVPVGGGCRKSRRARSSSRQSGIPNHGDHPTLSSPGGGLAGPTTESENSVTCIDLAAVFTKYVNPNVGPGNEESLSPGASSGSSDNCNQGSSLEIDSQLIEDNVTMFDHYHHHQKAVPMDQDQIQQVVPQFSVQQEIDGQDFVYQDFNGFDDQMQQQEQGMIGDHEIMGGGNVLWSEEGTSLGSQVQPMMQLVQDSGLFSPDDQFRISANLVPDNWSSFDLSTYEFFCNP